MFIDEESVVARERDFADGGLMETGENWREGLPHCARTI